MRQRVGNHVGTVGQRENKALPGLEGAAGVSAAGRELRVPRVSREPDREPPA